MLSNTIYRLTKENKLTIAYFGGSITENGEEKGWRRLTTKWFEARWPETKITEVNAAIGGTGTDLGVYRCGRDVLAHSPNLVFIEFAVNDSGSRPEDLSRNTEAIVRKILSADPTTEIVFVFTITKAIDERLKSGVPFHSRDIHSAIAAHYGRPTIDIGTPLAEAAAAEKGWLEYTTDTVHPHAGGYVIKEKALLNGLEPLLAANAPDSITSYPIPAPLYDNLPTNARMIDAYELAQLSDPSVDWGKAQPDTALERGWSKLFFHLCGRWPATIGANKPGSEFAIRFDGSNLGIYWMMASDSGDIEFSIDGGEWQRKSSFDEYCLRFARANFQMLAQGLPEGSHTVVIRVSETKDDRSTGRWVRIGAFGIS